MRLSLVLHVDGTSPHELQFALECMVAINRLYLQTHPATPRLYNSGVVYAEEPHEDDSVAASEERIASIPEVLRLGWGDCDDLVAWLCAERQIRDNLPAQPRVVLEHVSPDGSHHWHCLAVYPNGSAEDPSAVLGMGENDLQGLYPEEMR